MLSLEEGNAIFDPPEFVKVKREFYTKLLADHQKLFEIFEWSDWSINSVVKWIREFKKVRK